MAAEILTRAFESEIQNQLFPDGTFLSQSRNDDKFAGSTNSVEIPNSGTIPAVTVDRGVYPGTIAQRTDVAHQYILEELTTDPTHLPWHESLAPGGGRLAYDKRASVIEQHSESLNEKGENRAIVKWLAQVTVAAGTLIPSTGAGRATGGASQTGTRKKILEVDILAIKTKFDRLNVKLADRMMLVTGEQHGDLLEIDRFTSAERIGLGGRIVEGSVGRVHGFDVFVRSFTAISDSTNSDLINAEGAAAAAGDQDVAVFWQKNAVRKALGGIHAFVDLDKADFYGDILAYAIMFGAVTSRNDGIGVAAIFEDVV